MPYKDPAKNRAYQREYQRRRAAAKKAAKQQAPAPAPLFADPALDAAAQVDALARWSRETLVVPPGHSAAGQPLTLPDYAIRFLADALAHPESLLCMGRKNAKSAICAVLALGYLVGPLRRPGWRGAVASVNKIKANELRMQCEAIARASDLEGLRFIRSPQPGRIESASGMLEVLSADRTAGHASGFDVVLVDELGWFKEGARALMAGLRSSTSAKDGRVICISIRGECRLLEEIIERRGSDLTAVHLYSPPPNAALDDEAAWRAANPGLGTVKSLQYMRNEAARVALSPLDANDFRANDLNEPRNPDQGIPLVSVADFDKMVVHMEDLPPREGRAWAGFDLGGSSSMTALCVTWESGRVEVYGAFPEDPDLHVRGRLDHVGDHYARCADQGLLYVLPGRSAKPEIFLDHIRRRLGESAKDVVRIAADRYKQAAFKDAMQTAGLNWPIDFRSTVRDQAEDLADAQTAILDGGLKLEKNELLKRSLALACIVYKDKDNAVLDKRKATSRIDAAEAFLLAVGQYQRAMRRPHRPGRVLEMGSGEWL